MTEASDGFFFCDLCQTSYPDVIQEKHEAAHGPTLKEASGFTAVDGIFWLLCASLGVIAGLFVATL